jgi:hypothetical protein
MIAVLDEELAIPMPPTRDLSTVTLRAGLDRPAALRTLEREYASFLSQEQVAGWLHDLAKERCAGWSRRVKLAVEAGVAQIADQAAIQLRAKNSRWSNPERSTRPGRRCCASMRRSLRRYARVQIPRFARNDKRYRVAQGAGGAACPSPMTCPLASTCPFIASVMLA